MSDPEKSGIMFVLMIEKVRSGVSSSNIAIAVSLEKSIRESQMA